MPRPLLLASLLLALSLWPPASVHAQSARIRFSHLTTADGLPNNMVNCVLQDHLGYLWFGTQGGLSRYDGYTFTNFHHRRQDPASLVNDTVNALFEDSRGRLWIGTVNGLDRYDPRTETFLHYPDVYESVRAFAEDAQGHLWIGTAGSGLFRYDPRQETFRLYAHDPANPAGLSDNHINALLLDPQGTLWIATEYGGLNALDLRSETFASYPTPLPDAPPTGRLTALALTPQGDLWVGMANPQDSASGGLALFDLERRAFTTYYEPLRRLSVTSLLWDGEQLWLGAQDGLYRYDPAYGRLEAYRHDPADPLSLSADSVTALFQDRSRNLWIATESGGLSQYPRPRLRFDYYAPSADGLTTATVGAVLKDNQGFVWVGLHDHGLNRLDRRTGQVTLFRHDPQDTASLSHDHVTALYEDSRRQLWVGTPAGLDRLDRRIDRFDHFTWQGGGAVKVILEDHEGNLWIGTEEPGALLRLDSRTLTFTRYAYDDGSGSFPNTYGVRALLEDRDGALWVGTYNGLVRFDPHTQTFAQYRADPANPHALSHDFVWSLYQDANGTLWVGTHAGLNRLDGYFDGATPCAPPACEPTFTVYTTEDGLPDDSIVSMLGDEQGRLWLATMSGGLAVFDPASGAVRAYTESDGLQSNAFIIGAASRSSDGEMFFGGINGLNAFYPDRLSDNPLPPPLVLTTFRVFDQPRLLAGDLQDIQEIHLTYHENFFAFEFAALDFTDPARNQYAYRLENFDPDWVYCGTRRYASYTNLPPGRYVFHLKAANNDGVWNEAGLSLAVVIEPAFWQTWWFRLLVGLAVLGLVSAYLGGRMRYVAALRRSEERFRTLFENAPVGVCEADFSQTPPVVRHLNPRWEHLFGLRAGAVSSLTDCLPAETLARCRAHLESGETLTLETTGRRADGSQFPVRLIAASTPPGDLQRGILVVEDIRAERARRSEEEAIAEERRRIAREIHDGLAQDLAALRLQIRHWQSLADQNPPQLKEELDYLHRLLGEKIREVRRAIFALRPVALEELGFWGALERFLGEFGEQNQLHIELQVQGERARLPAALEPVLFRIVQEGLHNVARHAQARTAWVSLDLTEGIALAVRDDGQGFDPADLPRLEREGHLGLRQMRERIEALGGRLEVRSAPGEGTEIRVVLL